MLPVSLAVVLVFIEGVYFIIYQSDGWTVQWQAENASKGLNHLFVLFPTGSLSESFFFTFILPFYVAIVGFSCFFAWHTVNTAIMRYISFRLDVVKYRLENMRSNELTNALYSFNWYEVPLPLQKDIALFMGTSMRPITMKSSFINMKLNTFFMILKTSYSYFTLLQNFAK
ncbi:unnamed protein product [Hermetia illucens]|uniref:Uncharacterized protein n=1 Tax=Hermetia illucens TaxID=343691 RepID=A0A7R8YLL5_HERIL|nr:unnamed protein product [Hermetia illucens]